jgi:Clp amino terminal domain, pathogenicity island component/ClpX C4-type zinc finger
MIAQRVIRSVGRWLTRHQWAGSGGKGTEARTNQRGNFDRFTERARTVMQFSQEEAQRLQHNYIGTEHLLLGLLREREGVAGRVLTSLGVDLDQARQAVEGVVGRGDHRVSGEIRLTPRAKKVVELAVDEARRLHHHFLGTEHLLLGLLREGQGIGAGVLESFGLSLQEVRAHIIQVLKEQRKPALVCSFCRKQQDQVQRLIAGPGGVSVCDECVAALSSGPEAHQEEQGVRCSFCGKHQQQVSYLAIGPHGVNICQACLTLCQQIIAEDGPHQA